MLAHADETVFRIERLRTCVPLPNPEPQGLRSAIASNVDGRVHEALGHAPSMPRPRDIKTLEFERRWALHRPRYWPRYKMCIAHELGGAGLAIVFREQH